MKETRGREEREINSLKKTSKAIPWHRPLGLVGGFVSALSFHN